MSNLADCCLWDSDGLPQPKPVCSVKDEHSRGWLQITVDKSRREILRVYDLEDYFKGHAARRPDRLLLGRAETGSWVVVLMECKSGTGWAEARKKFEAVLHLFCKRSGNPAALEHHDTHRSLLGKRVQKHTVVAIVAGQVGREYRGKRRGDRKVEQRERNPLPYGVYSVPPISGKKFNSVADFWKHLGILPLG